VEADAVKVRQVVINLLSNAVKFTTRGSIGVRASSEPLPRGRCTVTIAVTDSGPGIVPEDLERIFGVFDQSNSGARAQGTGLGLAISRNFARLMGGDVIVESEPGKGSRFTFSFQAAPAQDAAAESSDSLVAIDAAERVPKVLVVDDVRTNRELLVDLLTRVGFETQVAASGVDGLRLHDEWRPDLVLMDLRMPGMDGFEATRRLRAAGSRAIIVALTASGLADIETMALAAGADAFFRKPYDERALLKKIGALLGIRYFREAAVGIASNGGAGRPLQELAPALPGDLVRRLREAAIEARAARLAALAGEVRGHSQEAAARIEKLLEDFRFDALLAELDRL
jgi:CheY-like chemotaxis protein